MFWDKAAKLYELFENIYNGKVNREFCKKVGEMINTGDKALECACGTGMISRAIAAKADSLIATDFSDGMLEVAKKKSRRFTNIEFAKANIMSLPFEDGTFDKVVAGNVIHLLDDPKGALDELLRVCKKGGEVIIPTYVSTDKGHVPGKAVAMMVRLGARFKTIYDINTYKEFFAEYGITNVEYTLVEGRMPSAIARIRVN